VPLDLLGANDYGKHNGETEVRWPHVQYDEGYQLGIGALHNINWHLVRSWKCVSQALNVPQIEEPYCELKPW
jgi:hypothetical protein